MNRPSKPATRAWLRLSALLALPSLAGAETFFDLVATYDSPDDYPFLEGPIETLTVTDVREAIADGVDVNLRSPYGGFTPLMFAVQGSNPEVIETLIAAGSDVSNRSDFGWTALMLAAESNENPTVVEVLLDAGADASATNGEDGTAFDLMKENEALVGTDAYWRLNDLRFE